MHYLNTAHITSLSFDWVQLIEAIKHTVLLMGSNEFEQPVKPYLRYRNKINRIIAMPAFIGGTINFCGIKWIASFPGNINRGLKRAHSVTILNDADTGVPVCTINTPLISGIRTAAVSGLILQKYIGLKNRDQPLTIGMAGFGPIGRLHFQMIDELLKGRIKDFRVYDVRGIDLDHASGGCAISECQSFEEAYSNADIFITATTSPARYITQPPKKGSLQLNISLRDYAASFKHFVDIMLVDSWDEVCRENTDIQQMHLQEGLQQEQVLDLVDVFCAGKMDTLAEEDVVMFNPMGMAVFDIAIAALYYKAAVQQNIGCSLDD
jgi:2,3-diaminopropionate biosynthesis protein SbnB